MTTDEIIKLLPQVMRRTCADWDGVSPPNPLMAIVQVMCGMIDPIDSTLLRFDDYLDPRRAPEEFVPMLARWVDLDRLFEPSRGEAAQSPRDLFPAGVGRLRELIVAATDLSQRRGTAAGLVDFLELATGTSGFVIAERVENDRHMPMPFHIRVIAPVAARPFERLIRRVIESERPAYVTYELAYTDP